MMDFTGMMLGYKKNRPLTSEERELQLKQKARLDIAPGHDQCVIRMNSTYLESVDRYYAWRGTMFGFLGALGVVCFSMLVFGFYKVAGKWPDFTPEQQSSLKLVGVFVVIGWGSVLGLFVWTILKESFTYTHFPIRLNRKNRKVYVFRPGRPNKPILVADWDKLFFTLGRCNRGAADFTQNWDIRAHVLSEDGNTVLDTFSFSVDSDVQDDLRSHWEFLRRYMEDGPQEAYESPYMVCQPLDGKKETFRIAYSVFYSNFRGIRWAWYILYPFMLLSIAGRWLAQQTDRIPVWPEEIERECRIEPDDPYLKDASMNPPDSWLW